MVGGAGVASKRRFEKNFRVFVDFCGPKGTSGHASLSDTFDQEGDAFCWNFFFKEVGLIHELVDLTIAEACCIRGRLAVVSFLVISILNFLWRLLDLDLSVWSLSPHFLLLFLALLCVGLRCLPDLFHALQTLADCS